MTCSLERLAAKLRTEEKIFVLTYSYIDQVIDYGFLLEIYDEETVECISSVAGNTIIECLEALNGEESCGSELCGVLLDRGSDIHESSKED